MTTRAEFLKSLGESLGRFEASRVAKLGCFTGLALVLLAILGGVTGFISTDPVFPHFIRILVLVLLGTLIVVFLLFAAMEGVSERRVLREIREYVDSGQADLETLLEMARTRAGRFPGSDRVIELLERASRGEDPGP